MSTKSRRLGLPTSFYSSTPQQSGFDFIRERHLYSQVVQSVAGRSRPTRSSDQTAWSPGRRIFRSDDLADYRRYRRLLSTAAVRNALRLWAILQSPYKTPGSSITRFDRRQCDISVTGDNALRPSIVRRNCRPCGNNPPNIAEPHIVHRGRRRTGLCRIDLIRQGEGSRRNGRRRADVDWDDGAHDSHKGIFIRRR